MESALRDLRVLRGEGCSGLVIREVFHHEDHEASFDKQWGLSSVSFVVSAVTGLCLDVWATSVRGGAS